MKIRIGYVTNSSSTNFLILSKKELTPEYLFKKLGFKKGSIIEQYALDLKYKEKGFHSYMGYTSSDEDTLTSFFTTDTFELEGNGIYINGRSCVW